MALLAGHTLSLLYVALKKGQGERGGRYLEFLSVEEVILKESHLNLANKQEITLLVTRWDFYMVLHSTNLWTLEGSIVDYIPLRSLGLRAGFRV